MSALAELGQLVIPDPWQIEAVDALQRGLSVVLTAPTGAGKTLVFEKYWEGCAGSQRAIYTVPTRALANDKWRDWKAKGWRVGLMTGDRSLELESPLIVATLEAAWGASAHGLNADLWVIDEFQMLADERRGLHYEAAILSCPPTTRFLMLSGSVANPEIVAEWLERIQRPTLVVKHERRPVPIEEVDGEELCAGIPPHVGDKLQRIFAGAVSRDLAPVLVFTPHRRDAEKMAHRLAAIPVSTPLKLTQHQAAVCSPALRKLLAHRVAYHHSGMTYAERAGVVEPLAKAGQLRFVVATLGLSAGVNFSLRSVYVARGSFITSSGERDITPHEFLQMIGRAGRRGLDNTGYYIAARDSLPLSHARPLRLHRAAAAPWSLMLAGLGEGTDVRPQAAQFPLKAFDPGEFRSGLERTYQHKIEPRDDAIAVSAYPAVDTGAGSTPCGLLNDTARARLVRRTQAPYPGCASCVLRAECELMSPQPTPIWWWSRLGLVDRSMRLTERGRIAAAFLGAEGLVIAALAEQRDIDTHAVIFELADLYASDRFPSEDARYSGRLAHICQSTYGQVSIAGYLDNGIPPGYGTGGAAVVERFAFREKPQRSSNGEVIAAKGDRDRLITEWTSLIKQLCSKRIAQIPSLARLRSAALAIRDLLPTNDSPIQLPQLTAEQRAGFVHRQFFR